MANARLTIPLYFSLLASALAVSASSSLTGCGGDSSGGSGGSSSTTSASSSASSGGACGLGADQCFDYSCFKGDAPAVSFKADVLPILRTSCGLSASCHGNEAGPGAQHYLGPKNSDPAPSAEQIQKIFTQSVGQKTVVESGMLNITPSDPAHSFFMYKLDGLACATLKCAPTSSCGALMPLGNTEPMDASKRDILRRWIAQGAKND